jgi:hypothetical protein
MTHMFPGLEADDLSDNEDWRAECRRVTAHSGAHPIYAHWRNASIRTAEKRVASSSNRPWCPDARSLQGLLRLRSRTWIPRLDYFTATSFTVSCSDQSSILSSG